MTAVPPDAVQLCGPQRAALAAKEEQIKGLMRDWEKQFPGRVESIFSALSTVVPSHLMDKERFDFAGLKIDGVANPLGDIAFDDEPCTTGAAVSGIIPLQRSDSSAEID